MSEEQFWHPANICTWGFGHPSQMDGLHSPTPHLHPSNSPSLSSICATCQGHIPTGQKGKNLSSLLHSEHCFLFSCAETFLLISQALPRQHGTGFWLREHWLLSCYTYLPVQRIRGPGTQQGCSHHSPFWNKLTRALHTSLLICQKCISLLLQHPPGQECCSLGSLSSPTKSGPVL